MRLVVLLLLLIALPAWAKPIFMSGFESPDAATANGDFAEFVSTICGTATDSAVGQIGNAECTSSGASWRSCSNTRGVGNSQNDARERGHVSSHRALQVSVTAAGAQCAYVSLPTASKCTSAGNCSVGSDTSDQCDYCTGLNTGDDTGFGNTTYQTLSATFNARFDQLPSAGNYRTIFQFMEGDPSTAPKDVGCYLQIKDDRSFRLMYGNSPSPATIGTTTVKANNNACAGGTAPDRTIGCAADGDCPGSGAGRCTTCTTGGAGGTSPQNCYWAPIGITQSLTGGAVTCTLRLRGQTIISGSVTTSQVGTIADVRLGAVNSNEAFALQATFDDLVLDDSLDPGWGYVATAAPGLHGTCSVTTSRQCDDSTDCPGGEKCTNADDATMDGVLSGGWLTNAASSVTHASILRDIVDATRTYHLVSYTTGTGIRVKNHDLLEQFWRMMPNNGICAIANDCAYQDGGGSCTNLFCSALPTVAPDTIPETNATVTAVQISVSGQTDGTSATREIALAPMTCTRPSTSVICNVGRETLFSIGTRATDHTIMRSISTTRPGGSAWERSDIPNLGVQLRSTANYDASGNRETRVAALWAYISVSMQQAPARNIRDHSRGVKACTTSTDCAAVACNSATDYTSAGGAARTCGWCEKGVCLRDGKLTIATVGDSTNGGTDSSACVGGSKAGCTTLNCATCTQKDYCSWDAYNAGTGHFADHPPGGCNRNDSRCHVCVSKVNENGNTGWPCGDSLDCPQTGGTCDSGTTPAICLRADGTTHTTTPCCRGAACVAGVCADTGGTCDDSCNGFGGTCQLTATCDLSCPGGQCTCSNDTQCDGSASSCTGGLCKNATRVCSVNDDCAFGQTCGGNVGFCPTERNSWGAHAADNLSVDTLLICTSGGDRTSNLVQSRFDAIMTGGRGCEAAIGTGHCTCTGNSNCGASGTCCLTPSGCSSNTVDYGTCSVGTTNEASCTKPGDCDTTNAQTCQFSAPDLIETLEGFNDPYTFPMPNCRGTNVMRSIYPCDPAFNPKLPKNFCMSDADAVAANNSTNSQCYGLKRDDALGPALCARSGANAFFGPCTIDQQDNDSGIFGAPNCAIDSECTGGTCSCPSAGCTETWPEGQTNRTYNIGICHQSACNSGFRKVGGICHFDCTTDSDCTVIPSAVPGICSKYCNASSGANIDKACTQDSQCTPGTCTSNGTSNKVCQGRATAPSDSLTCSSDRDCQSVIAMEEDVNLVGGALPLPTVLQHYDGTCVAGKCTCMGRPVGCFVSTGFTPADNYCPAQTARWWTNLTHTLAARNFHEMERRVAALNQSVVPTLLFATLPETITNGCTFERAQPEGPYYGKVSRHILAEFPLVADARAAMSAVDFGLSHTDNVHFNALGASTVGATVNAKNAAFNTCVTSAGTAQLYCYTPAGTVTTCSVSADCNGSSAGTCSGGKCICSNTGAADCPAYNTCQILVCTSGTDCPASTDSCNLQP